MRQAYASMQVKVKTVRETKPAPKAPPKAPPRPPPPRKAQK